MRALRASKILGIAITEQGLLVAEVTSSGDKREVKHTAEFTYPAGKSANDLASLGKLFGQFLKQNSFGARQAVMGLPMNWVVMKAKEVPASDETAAANILRLQAESDFSAELRDLVYDYAGTPDKSGPRPVLLMAAPRDRLTQIEEFARNARISVEGVAPAMVALAAASKTMALPEGLIVYLSPRSAEVAFSNNRGLQRLRSFALASVTAAAGGGAAPAAPTAPTAPASPDAAGATPPATPPAPPPMAQVIAAELRRTLVSLPQNGTPASARKLVLWDGAGLDDADCDLISQRVGLQVRARPLSDLGVTSTDPAAARFAPAIALALSGTGATPLPVDFLDPRLAPPKESSVGKIVMWSVLAAIIVLGGGGYVAWDTSNLAKTATDLEAKYKTMEQPAQKAQAKANMISMAESWYPKKQRFLDCLLDLQNAFPQTFGGTNPAIATQIELAVADAASAGAAARGVTTRPAAGTDGVVFTGKITGKAGNNPAVRSDPVANTIAKNLKESRHFKDVFGPNFTANRQTGEWTFSITFTYIGD